MKPGILILMLSILAQIGTKSVAIPVNERIWQAPYRQSLRYPHHLENENGDFLWILNKTAWTYFAAENPESVIEQVQKHGANVIRVCLEGTPYYKTLGYDLWPWQGSREAPEYGAFNASYLDEVERRIALAGSKGIGIDLVLYFTLVPEAVDFPLHQPYLQTVIERFSKYSNLLVWEIMNETASNEAFQDLAGRYLKAHDPFRHPVISSTGTTDDALWPQKDWMDMAVVHTCTGNQDAYDLEHWYLNIAQNLRQYGKPCFNNESGRERRHRNDDPVHRRKQGWLFSNTGCFWTWHSWDGCEGINDTEYLADGWQYLKPMRSYYEGLPFWDLVPNHTICRVDNPGWIVTTMSQPSRELTVIYACLRESGVHADAQQMRLRLPNGDYAIRFLRPADLYPIDLTSLVSEGLRETVDVLAPAFQDDLLIEIRKTQQGISRLIEGTQ